MKEKAGRKRVRSGTSIAVAALSTCVFIAAVVASLFLVSNANAKLVAAGVSDSMLIRHMTGFVIVGIPALVALGISINHRCINATVRGILMTIDIAMIVWLCAACIITIEFDVTNPPLIAIAVISDLVIALFIESYIDARIFPSIHRYRALFYRLPFDLRIVNEGGRVIYKTDASRSLDNTTLIRLAKQTPKTMLDPANTVFSDATPDVLFKVYRLSGGSALLTEDAAEINRLQEKLEARQAQMMAQNETLMRNHSMQSILYRQQRERELSEQVERDLASAAAQINSILDNRIDESQPNARAERLQQLNLVKVLVAYCKRKGMLALAAAESDMMSSEQLKLVTRESMADLHSIGIECAVLVESSDSIPIEAINTIYDSYYDCVLSVLPKVNPIMMTYITTRENMLEMRMVIECAIGLDDENAVEMIPPVATSTESWTAVQLGIARDLESRLAQRGIDYTVTLDEGLVNVTVHAPAPMTDQGGETHQGGDC